MAHKSIERCVRMSKVVIGQRDHRQGCVTREINNGVCES